MSYGETFKLDSTSGDLSITSKKIDMITNGDKIGQDLRILLQTIRGENILHRGLGLDILTESTLTEKAIEAKVRATLKQYHYELTIQSLEVTIDRITRITTIALKVTVEGEEEVEVHV